MVEQMGGVRGHRWTPPQLSLLRTEAALKAERLELGVVIHGPGLIEDLARGILDLIPQAGVELHRSRFVLTPSV